MTKESMIERMCRAMCRDQYPGADEDEWLVTPKCWRWELFRSQAKVALEALREPTEEMAKATGAHKIKQRVERLEASAWAYANDGDVERQAIADQDEALASAYKTVLSEIADDWQAMIDVVLEEQN